MLLRKRIGYPATLVLKDFYYPLPLILSFFPKNSKNLHGLTFWYGIIIAETLLNSAAIRALEQNPLISVSNKIVLGQVELLQKRFGFGADTLFVSDVRVGSGLNEIFRWSGQIRFSYLMRSFTLRFLFDSFVNCQTHPCYLVARLQLVFCQSSILRSIRRNNPYYASWHRNFR